MTREVRDVVDGRRRRDGEVTSGGTSEQIISRTAHPERLIGKGYIYTLF
jgi:hypothetical protein